MAGTSKAKAKVSANGANPDKLSADSPGYTRITGNQEHFITNAVIPYITKFYGPTYESVRVELSTNGSTVKFFGVSQLQT